MRRLQQREIDDLLAIAERGGIGQATALTDCVAAGPDQLMYMEDDNVILLKDEGDEFLAFCEGEVGWVKRHNIVLAGACASSSTPTSPSFLPSTSGFREPQDMHSGDWSSPGDQTPTALAPDHFSSQAAVEPIATKAGRHSGPFELDSSRFSRDEESVRSPHMLQDDTLHHNGPQQPTPSLTRSSSDADHARTASVVSGTSSSVDSNESGPIGGLVLGGNVKSDHSHSNISFEESSPIGFPAFGTFPSQSSSSAFPSLRSLGSQQHVKSVQRVNYATTAPIKRQSVNVERARAASTASELNHMEGLTEEAEADLPEEAEDDALPITNTRSQRMEGSHSKGSPSPSPPGRPPRRRPVELSLVRNSQVSDTSTARVSDSAAPHTPRSLDTFGGDGLRSRELLLSPDKSIRSGASATSRDSDLRTSMVGGMFSNSDGDHDADYTEALLPPRTADGDGRFSLSYLRDSYASGAESDATPRPDRSETSLIPSFTGLPLTTSPPASSESLDHQMSRRHATPSQDDTEDDTTLDTPQSTAVSSFARHGQPTVAGSQSSGLSVLGAPLIIDERPGIDTLNRKMPQHQRTQSGGFSATHGSPASNNSHSAEGHAVARAASRNKFYALGHSPHIALQSPQSWNNAAAHLAQSEQEGWSGTSSTLTGSPASAEYHIAKALPAAPQPAAFASQHSTPSPGSMGRKLSLDALRSRSSEDRIRMVFTNEQDIYGNSMGQTSSSSAMEEHLDDRSSHGWSHAAGGFRQRSPQTLANRERTNGSAPTYVESNGSGAAYPGSGAEGMVDRTPPQGSRWGQQRHMANQRSPPTHRMRPSTPDQLARATGNFARRMKSSSASEDSHVEVVARPLDAFLLPPRNLTPVGPSGVPEFGKLSLATPSHDDGRAHIPPPNPSFHQQATKRSATPSPEDRPQTPSAPHGQRSRSKSISAAIAKTMGRARKQSFDLPLPRPIVDSGRQRSDSPTMAMSLDAERIPAGQLQLPSGKFKGSRVSHASVRAIHHMPLGDEPPPMPFHTHGRSASGPQPSVDTIPRRPSTGMKGQYNAGVSYLDFASTAVKTEGMEFELLQPRKTSDGAPMVTLKLDTTDLSFSGLLSSEGHHTDSESSHSAAVQSSSEHHFDQTAPPPEDEWGFIKDCSPTPVIFQSRQPASEVRAAEQKWLEIIAKPMSFNGSPPKKVRRLVIEHGVPASLRGRVWGWFMSNGLSGRVEGLFPRLLTNEPGEYDEQIDRDVGRVYCDHGAFWHRNSPGQQNLRTLLRAYVLFAPSGYRSELALIAGALLIHAVIEDAFWLMAGLFNGTLKTYYVKEKTAFTVDLHVFAGILAGSEPKLAALFRDVGVSPHDYLRQWWMSLYIRCLPWPTVLRFFDAVISEGPRYMFISALAVLTLSRDRLLSLPKDRNSVLGYLRHLPQDSMLLPDNFMRACDAVKLRDDDLKKMRASVKDKMANGQG